MSTADLKRFVGRVATDEHFRALFEKDPQRAMAPFDLTAQEREAALKPDESKIRDLGVNQVVAKLVNLWTTGD